MRDETKRGGGAYSYARVNVAAQQRDPHSLLQWTAGLIRLRREWPEVGCGMWEIIPTGNAHVLALRYEWRGTSVLTLHNFVQQPPEVELTLPERLIDLRTPATSAPDEHGVHRVALDEYGYRWLRLGTLNYALHRSL